MSPVPTTIFGNPVSRSVQKKALRKRAGWVRKLGDDSGRSYRYALADNPVLTPLWGVKNLDLAEAGPTPEASEGRKPLVIGTIRMGYGHYRISMAIASAAAARNLEPWWFDLHSFQDSVGGRIVRELNGLYSLGSRLSQKSALFNRFVWEPLNSEWFRTLDYNAADQAVSSLFAGLARGLPAGVPVVGTHVWPAQAAVHAGVTRVINVVPDNWPMGLHLAEGAVHTVQTPSAYWGYRTLSGMAGKTILKPMPGADLVETGHYIDHEIVSNLPADCGARIRRRNAGEPLRILMTIGGAGAQKEFYRQVIDGLADRLRKGQVQLLINAGDHRAQAQALTDHLAALGLPVETHDDWSRTAAWASTAADGFPGHHVFVHDDVFAAVYSTNVLLRFSDVLMTKPGELAFYPVPKLLVRRVGGHEAWGAIRSAEVGDGTPECPSPSEALRILGLMADEPGALVRMNQAILRAQAQGTYDGAYRVVDLALASK